jgi:hypothetical protein
VCSDRNAPDWARVATSPGGKLVFGIFAALAEFERKLIVERTRAGLAAARARGRNGGRPYKMTPAELRLAMASMGKPETRVGELCAELGISRQTLYRHVDPEGNLRPDGRKLLGGGKQKAQYSGADRLSCLPCGATGPRRRGVPREQVQYLLGHSDARTTDLYNRTEKEVTRNIVERITL